MKNDKLHNIETTGFRVPDDYFDSIEDAVFNKINSPLTDIKASGFKVPDNYFTEIDEKVLKTIGQEETKVVSIFNRQVLLYVTGIAAAVVLMFSIFINKTDELPLDSEMVETYLVEQDLSSYELASLLEEADFLDEDFIIIEEQINATDLESYLLDNVNIEDIIEQ